MASPAQRHREDTFRRHADEYERVTCYFAEEGGCRGRLQAAHIIGRQVLKREVSKMALRQGTRSLSPVELDAILADGRNGVPACERHHHLHEGPVLHLAFYPWDFLSFVDDYGLEHVIDYARGEAA